MNVDSVLGSSLTIRVTIIKSGVYESVREGLFISSDPGRGTADFSAGHSLRFNRNNFLHGYSPYYGLSADAMSTKFIKY
jgi:hypothetical protein